MPSLTCSPQDTEKHLCLIPCEFTPDGCTRPREDRAGSTPHPNLQDWSPFLLLISLVDKLVVCLPKYCF
ncbi:hypothetical protein AV530_000552 [Patagioenas fasciata monilis]|uniref:Uncharacterized protein n=1 Tax=Patagioenas fasciata monilis TaxID=372326 RepID=A0A1V4IFN7_PATFA|nr:hypothetical protein AV530_000552 [Patagioenas fasciata monilis]